MAKKQEEKAGVLDVIDVEERADDLEEQAEALLAYRVSGEMGIYRDQSRDQEPDIAPELGVAPHPELANPAPPEDLVGQPGIGQPAPESANLRKFEDMPAPEEDKADEAALAAEEALLAGVGEEPVARDSDVFVVGRGEGSPADADADEDRAGEAGEVNKDEK